MNQVAEGLRTTRAASALAEIHGVERPLSDTVRMLLDGELRPPDVVHHITSLQLRSENE